MKAFGKAFTSIRQKIIVFFTILIVITSVGIVLSSVLVFSKSYHEKATIFVGDTNRQTTNNLEDHINVIEDMSFNILSNSIVQSSLGVVNSGNLTEFELRNMHLSIEGELEKEALYNKNIVSVSVISNTGDEFTVQKKSGREILRAFSEQEAHDALGSTLWGMAGEEHNICVARSILNLQTMEPIGYINIVCEPEFFGNIVEDISRSYSSGTYVVNEDGRIMATNNSAYEGQQFPMELSDIKDEGISYYNAIDEVKAFYFKGEPMSNGWTLVTTVPIDELHRDITNVAVITGGICVVMLILAVLVSGFISAKITRPTEELLESMKTFGKGNWSQRVKICSKDEIGQIGQEYNQMAENIENLIEKVYKMELSQKQAEIEFLKMQINPHFLYNTLDTISWMALMKECPDISEMTIALAELLRAAIKSERFVTVKEEVETVKDYLFIQQYRFGDKITVSYHQDQGTDDYVMPGFMLQPLIENAIIHGLEPKVDKGHLDVQIRIQEEKLWLCVSDDGVGMTKQQLEELYQRLRGENEVHSLGVKNVYRRLQLYYGESCTLHIESSCEKGTTVSFQIPLDTCIPAGVREQYRHTEEVLNK